MITNSMPLLAALLILILMSTAGYYCAFKINTHARFSPNGDQETPLADQYLRDGVAWVITKSIDPGTRIRIPSLSEEEKQIDAALAVGVAKKSLPLQIPNAFENE